MVLQIFKRLPKSHSASLKKFPELNTAGGTVRDYCLSYACHPEKKAWEMTAWACVCFGDSAIATVDRMMDSDLRRWDEKPGNTENI